ncbi:MAG: PDGLE domain-containing protein [Iphinoe sp. HA4291-MV1]|nr:PDGLE domain-containing protein [Iphinoe sp. HA4291-MV1]
MSSNLSRSRNRAFVITGLGIALLIAIFLSPLASKNPDGLDRVSQDLKFDSKELQDKPAKKLPFYAIFDEYALRGVPEAIATPLAGLVGTLATFGLAWGIGKLVVRGSGTPSTQHDTYPNSDD